MWDLHAGILMTALTHVPRRIRAASEDEPARRSPATSAAAPGMRGVLAAGRAAEELRA